MGRWTGRAETAITTESQPNGEVMTTEAEANATELRNEAALTGKISADPDALHHHPGEWEPEIWSCGQVIGQRDTAGSRTTIVAGVILAG